MNTNNQSPQSKQEKAKYIEELRDKLFNVVERHQNMPYRMLSSKSRMEQLESLDDVELDKIITQLKRTSVYLSKLKMTGLTLDLEYRKYLELSPSPIGTSLTTAKIESDQLALKGFKDYSSELESHLSSNQSLTINFGAINNGDVTLDYAILFGSNSNLNMIFDISNMNILKQPKSVVNYLIENMYDDFEIDPDLNWFYRKPSRHIIYDNTTLDNFGKHIKTNIEEIRETNYMDDGKEHAIVEKLDNMTKILFIRLAWGIQDSRPNSIEFDSDSKQAITSLTKIVNSSYRISGKGTNQRYAIWDRDISGIYRPNSEQWDRAIDLFSEILSNKIRANLFNTSIDTTPEYKARIHQLAIESTEMWNKLQLYKQQKQNQN
jgi:hypothetical protein